MSYAIIRIAKIKSAQRASDKVAHNYRKHSLSNVDQDAPHPNREYLNNEKRDYWELADERISQVVKRKVRSDQVKAVEIVMTGSPEAFKRDAEGKALDYSKSKWAGDNLRFLQGRYGKENVISFTLHQDEKTPHIHAVIVPITADGRLSAKELFTPETLRKLQTEYAQVMQPYGMERGIEHSQTKHQPPRRMYSQVDQAAQLVPGPVPVEAVKLGEIPLFGRDEWRAKEEARVNEEFAQQVGQVQQRVDKAVQQSQANASAQEQVKTLRKQLATSEKLKQAHFEEAKQSKQQLDRLTVGMFQSDLATVQELINHAQQIREQVKKALTEQLEKLLRGKVANVKQFSQQLQDEGYVTRKTDQGTELVHKLTGARFPLKEVQPNGQLIGVQLTSAIERTQQKINKRGKGLSI